MGMTMAFYYIVNRGFSKEEIREALSAIASGEDSAEEELSVGLSREAEEMLQRLGKENGLKNFLDMVTALRGDADPVVAYGEGIKLLPYYETNKCEGYMASSRDNAVLARLFKTPVLSFSVFDSDILLVSYSEGTTGVSADHGKTNCPGMEEAYDMEEYSPEFPAFLSEYCDEADGEKLHSLWESKDYVFAEDRMADMVRLLGAEPLYDPDNVPEGLEVLRADRGEE